MKDDASIRTVAATSEPALAITLDLVAATIGLVDEPMAVIERGSRSVLVSNAAFDVWRAEGSPDSIDRVLAACGPEATLVAGSDAAIWRLAAEIDTGHATLVVVCVDRRLQRLGARAMRTDDAGVASGPRSRELGRSLLERAAAFDALVRRARNSPPG